ncbi:hypothetical protein EDD18DRAFT_1108175 [Armillaria luteobubalina]|uniref:Uncharacterized protein n=1 Tax=Armillaria luteobubalina TaxID=153913 RepID=A0AA39ULV1_9AGAR|nr:hypothetical protein EDD18DRAFT_1108175 [Armillaria luteobubalina]
MLAEKLLLTLLLLAWSSQKLLSSFRLAKVYLLLRGLVLPVLVEWSNGVLQPTLARRVSYGDLTATEVTAVVNSGSEEEGSDAEHAGTQAGTSIHIDEDGSDDGSGTHNEFIDDIADKFSGQSSSDDAKEFYDCENVDAAGRDMLGSPNLSQTVDPPVVAAPAVQGRVDVPDNATHRASSRPKVKTKKALLQDHHAADLYAIDVACAVASQSVVSPPPATVYLEDLDGPPMPSQAAACSRNSKKKAVPVSLSQIPVHTSFGSMSSSNGVVPVPVKTMGVPMLSGASVTAKSKASAKTMSPPVSVDVPSLPPAAGDTPCSAVAASVGLSDDDDDHMNMPSAGDPSAVSAPPLPEPEDDALCVMLPEIQEEQLHAHYVALPGLGTVRVMVPIGQDLSSFDQPCYVTIEDVARLFNKNTIYSLIAAQQFTGSSPYCNLSTLGHVSITCDGRKALYRGHTAVTLVMGVVVESALNISTARIFLATRALSMVQQNNNNRYPSPVLQKKAPAAEGGQSGNLTPSRSAWPKSPLKPATLASRPVPEQEYYHCLGFNDEVPIFDGRASKGSHFLFCSADFTGLAALLWYP